MGSDGAERLHSRLFGSLRTVGNDRVSQVRGGGKVLEPYTQMISSAVCALTTLAVLAAAARLAATGERGRIGLAACLPGDPDRDVMPPGWFVHAWYGKRGMRHFQLGQGLRPAPRPPWSPS